MAKHKPVVYGVVSTEYSVPNMNVANDVADTDTPSRKIQSVERSTPHPTHFRITEGKHLPSGVLAPNPVCH